MDPLRNASQGAPPVGTESMLHRLWRTVTAHWRPALASPWQLERERRALDQARARELELLQATEREIDAIRRGEKVMLANGEIRTLAPLQRRAGVPCQDAPLIGLRSLERLGSQEAMLAQVQRGINLARALMYAEEEVLLTEGTAPPERVDRDWFTRWRDSAGGVTAEPLQRLWARTLVGEVRTPGSYSLRTLDFLRNLNLHEAELIAKVAPYVILGMVSKADEAYLEQVGIGFGVLLELDHLGVISGVDGLGIKKQIGSSVPDRFFNYIIKAGKILVLERDLPAAPIEVSGYKVTQVGEEVLSLGYFDCDERFLEILGLQFKALGFRVALGDWAPEADGSGRYRNAREL